jgi:4-diphosphocytidyl-2-C-methyl-D-erythritol kinase
VPEPLRSLAHAKVNLILEVLGARSDGYHEVDTVLQELELADAVELRAADHWQVHVSGPRAHGTPEDETNLALLAAQRLAERLGRTGECFSILLEKHIPAAGGLGGGASDAACVLRLLGHHWPECTASDLETVANALGSDEAFFLVGGTTRATGRGEILAALPPLPPHDVVLFIPPQTIERKTPRMFAALDRHEFDSGSISRGFVALPPQRFASADAFNAFERVAFDLFPFLAGLWADLEQRTRFPIRLCGAGPCLFWIGRPEEGEYIARAAAGAECQVILTRTVDRQ